MKFLNVLILSWYMLNTLYKKGLIFLSGNTKSDNKSFLTK